MAAAAFHIPPPQPMLMTGNKSQNWKDFRSEWEDYHIASGLAGGDKNDDGTDNVQGQTRSAATLRSVMGRECTKTLRSLAALPPGDKDKPAAILKALSDHFIPQNNVLFDRYQFFTATQRADEQASEFAVRLRVLAEPCELGALVDSLIRDRLVIGTTDAATRDRLFRERPVPGLDRCTELLQAAEISRGHRNVMYASEPAGAATTSIDAMREDRKSAPPRRLQQRDKGPAPPRRDKDCAWCGKEQHPRSQCPARNSTCRTCERHGHWTAVCRGGARRGGVNAVRQDELPDGRDDSPPNYDADARFDSISDAAVRTEAHAVVSVSLRRRTVSVRGKVDTGASDSILPLRTFRRMFPTRVNDEGVPVGLQPSHTRLIAYNGSAINHYGTIPLTCMYRGNTSSCRFFVADGPGPVIFGLPMCTAMGLVKFNCSVSTNVHVDANACASDFPRLSPPATLSRLQQAYPDRFTGIGKFPGTHSLTLKSDATPTIHAPRKAPIHLQGKIKAELHKMVDMGVIRSVDEPTDWVSSLVYAIKQDGSLRVCLDPKDLNKALKRGQHHIPTTEELTHRFTGATVFSKLDAKAGYWSVMLDDDSQLLTTFNSPVGRFCFQRLPFGLNVSQDVFQSAMDRILDNLPGVVSIADDIVVHGEDQKTHDDNLNRLMDRAKSQGLVFNPQKCHISEPEVSFFGHIYSKAGVRPDPKKVQAIHDLKPPKSVKELQSLLGMFCDLSSYIPHLSDHTTVLRQLLKKDVDFQWHHEHNEALRSLKGLVSDASHRVFFDPTRPTTIQVDASMNALGAALVQDGRVVAFASKSLSPTETRYANIERELLACVFGAERFHTYVYGQPFVIESDHKPLEMISQKHLSAAPARLQRMFLRLQRYDYAILYRPGKEMTLADALSRAPKTSDAAEHIPLDVQICHVQHSTHRLNLLREATATDPEAGLLKKYISDGFPDDSSDFPRSLRGFWSYRDELTIDDGIILKGNRAFIPQPLRGYYLEKIHEGHQGVTKCQLLARGLIYWPGIDKDIATTVTCCHQCQKHQASRPQLPHMPLAAELPQVPWHTLSADIFALDSAQYLIICDYHSRYPVVERLSTHSSSAEVASLCSNAFAMFGVPTALITDNGPHFIGREFHRMIQELDISHRTSSPHHPQSHGFIERSIRTVKACMRKSKLDTHIALLNLRITPIDATTPSPAELLFGRKIGSTLPTKVDAPSQHRRPLAMTMAREPEELPLGTPVYYQDVARKTWLPGSIAGIGPEPRSYTVQTTDRGTYLRRNRALIRRRTSSTSCQPGALGTTRMQPPTPAAANERPAISAQPAAANACPAAVNAQDTPAQKQSHTPPQPQPPTLPTPSVATQHHTPMARTQTRSGRMSQPPQRLIEAA